MLFFNFHSMVHDKTGPDRKKLDRRNARQQPIKFKDSGFRTGKMLQKKINLVIFDNLSGLLFGLCFVSFSGGGNSNLTTSLFCLSNFSSFFFLFFGFCFVLIFVPPFRHLLPLKWVFISIVIVHEIILPERQFMKLRKKPRTLDQGNTEVQFLPP